MTRVARGLLLTSLAALSGVASAPPKLDAAEILRRAEEIRNPDADRAIEASVRMGSAEGRGPQRESSFSMVFRGRTGTMLLRRTPPVLAGSVFMIDGSKHWSLNPRQKNPVQLADGQVMFGDIQSADLARLDFSQNWRAKLVGEERFETDACYKLELSSSAGSGLYTRILYWVEKKDFLPRRLELYGTNTGRLLRMVRYEDFQRDASAIWPKKMLVEGGNPWEEMSVVSFSNPRKVDVAALSFGTAGMTRFRDAAMVTETAPLESVLGLLASNPVAPAEGAPASPQQ